MRAFVLEENNWKNQKSTVPEVAILPWGATEAHNYHLPYGTDNYIARRLAEESARLAMNQGTSVTVLPTVCFGVNTGQPDILLDLNLNPSTQMMILKDVLTVLSRQGVKKFVILNAHGGNDFKQMIRELNLLFPGMLLTQCNWFKIPEPAGLFQDLGEHAGEVETSLMLHLFPELVLPLDEAGEGKAKKFRVRALNQGWAWAERKWSSVTTETGIGNPSGATAAKGAQFFAYLTETIATFLTELGASDLDDLYL
ncbi:MAG: creatininase family protein [Marinilabiliales bacterium]|nr:creatininase family protein [Marinilabiliales bacterium]